MTQPLFDFDLKRVSLEHYITGKAAINFPHHESPTGGWHFLSYFDRDSGLAKVSLAGIHYPDTTGFFGDAGVIDVSEQLAKRGWFLDGQLLFMADHYRAAADMIVRWALSESEHCNIEIDEWFPSLTEKQRLLKMLDLAKPKLFEVGRIHKVETWLDSQ
ncbi:hypothetical protein [Pseudomonas kielensis]|uniref:Uncharacterized protein n=1 Tax=Pseudomonas kielensis TaxID=2762577 RepID=A0A7X1G990_9PSED|nr:hypothetical protein [Pseudomonas kielensis]MBC2688197.1 hypothetical protein [Pseudomonas kielensis]